MKAETKTGVNEFPLEENAGKKGKAEKKSGKRIGYYYIIVKSLKEHRKNDVVKCFFIKGLTKWGFCVIKEGTLGDSTDKHGRDIKDRLLWQKELHETLQSDLDLPKYYGEFEENGNYYLVIEHKPGKSLGSLLREVKDDLRNELINGGKTAIKFAGYLVQIAKLVQKLHDKGIVHRDATSGNFMISRGGRVSVIDMELSYSVNTQYPSPAFDLGTTGFMSPQQEQRCTPTLHEDIFAIGAIILQVWTGISPSKLTRFISSGLRERVRFFIPDARIADLVTACLDQNIENRPPIAAVVNELETFRKELARKSFRTIQNKQVVSTEAWKLLIQQSLDAISSPLMADKEKGWFAENQDTAKEESGKLDKGYYGSFQFGVAGPMYLISKAATLGFNIDAAIPHINNALKLISTKYINKNISTSGGLYYGGGGVGIALASAIGAGLIEEDPHKAWINQLLQRTYDSPALFDGRAGQGIALSSCFSFIDQFDPAARMKEDASVILSSLQKNGVWQVQFKKKIKVYPGFLYGNSGSLYYLLHYAQMLGDQIALQEAEKGLQWLIKKSQGKKENRIWKSPSGHRIGFAWAEGNGGIALTFIKAWAVTGNLLYRQVAESALAGIDPFLMDNNLSQYSGLAGLGEIYLEAFKTFKDDHWLHRASWICDILYNTRLHHPKYGCHWQVEQERHPVAGFMVGNSGILHFLMRYCFPDQLDFPLFHNANVSSNRLSGAPAPANLHQIHP